MCIVMFLYDLVVVLWEYFFKDWLKCNRFYKIKYGKESNCFFFLKYGEELFLCYLNNSFLKIGVKINI